MTETLVIRPSSLDGFVDCAGRAFASSFPDLVKAAGYTINETQAHCGAAVGTGVHAAAAYTLQSKVDTGEIGHADEAEDRAVHAFRDGIANGAAWDEVTNGPNIGEVQVRRMTLAYRQHVAPKVQPSQVEKRLEADLDPGFILSGQADNCELRPDGVRDLKTGRFARMHHAQIGSYSILRRSYGFPVERLSVDFIQRVSVKKEQPAPVTSEYDPAFAEQVAWQRIQYVQRMVAEFRRSGDTMAVIKNPQSQLCSKKFCRAFGSDFCRQHAGATAKTLFPTNGGT
jgi:hypothetical protein